MAVIEKTVFFFGVDLGSTLCYFNLMLSMMLKKLHFLAGLSTINNSRQQQPWLGWTGVPLHRTTEFWTAWKSCSIMFYPFCGALGLRFHSSHLKWKTCCCCCCCCRRGCCCCCCCEKDVYWIMGRRDQSWYGIVVSLCHFHGCAPWGFTPSTHTNPWRD